MLRLLGHLNNSQLPAFRALGHRFDLSVSFLESALTLLEKNL